MPFNSKIMKKTLTTIAIALFTGTWGFAHYIWIETPGTGTLGNQQEIKVFFGEYTYGVLEETNGDAYKKVADFQLWIIAPNGTKVALQPRADASYYVAHFTPSMEGTYTVVLDNNTIDVIDYTQYDYGIFRPHYHATARIQVGNKIADTSIKNPEGLAIKQLGSSEKDIRLQVFYKGRPLAKNELKVYVSDLWSKTLETDNEGVVHFSLPWKTTYTMETTFREKVPGIYKGEDYEFIWHCATYTILNE